MRDIPQAAVAEVLSHYNNQRGEPDGIVSADVMLAFANLRIGGEVMVLAFDKVYTGEAFPEALIQRWYQDETDLIMHHLFEI
jgi:hypothetical protein